MELVYDGVRYSVYRAECPSCKSRYDDITYLEKVGCTLCPRCEQADLVYSLLAPKMIESP